MESLLVLIVAGLGASLWVLRGLDHKLDSLLALMGDEDSRGEIGFQYEVEDDEEEM